jgi:hypothetical protein
MLDPQTAEWKHGLLAAFIGGAASAFDSGLALILIAPNEFNLNSKLWHTLLTVLVLGVLSGIKLAAAYLKQSPTPRDVWDESKLQEQLGGQTNAAGAGK